MLPNKEDSDFSAAGAAWSGLALLGGLAVLGALLLLLQGHFARPAEERDQSPLPGLSAAGEAEFESGALRARLDAEAGRRLHSYGWVDRRVGIAHIPIERALELWPARAKREAR